MGRDSTSEKDENLLNSYFNSHMRTIWEKAAWPDICPYGERWTPDANGIVQFDMEEVLKTDMKAFWPLNEAASAARENAYTPTGTKDLSDNNSVTQADGLVDFAASFASATSEFLNIADEADLSTGDIDYSIHVRVRMTTKSADMMIVSRSESASVREYELFYDLSEDRFRFECFDSTGTSIGAIDADELGSPLISTWYDITAIHSKTDNCMSIKVNGKKADTTETTGAPSDTASDLRVGAKFATEQDFFNGRIQDLGFWKKLLTEGESDRLWNNGNTLKYPFTSEKWRIDKFIQLWDDDPTGTSYVDRLNWVPVQDGALILSTVPKTVYTHYRLRVPSYTGADWASGTSFVADDQTYLTTNGKFYICLAAHSNRTPPDTVFWQELVIPHNFFEYAARMTFSDLRFAENDLNGGVMHQRQASGLMMDAFEAMPPQAPLDIQNHLTEQSR